MLATAMMLIGLLSIRANADTLYTSGSPATVTPPIGTRGSAPSPDLIQTVATTFSLPNDSTLTGFTAEAIYSADPSLPLPSDDLFHIVIYRDSGSDRPGNVLASLSTSSFTRTDTNVNYTDVNSSVFDVFLFDVEFASGLNLIGGSYWISIINATPTDPVNRWSWTFSSAGLPTDPRYASNKTDQFHAYTFASDRSMVFTIEGMAMAKLYEFDYNVDTRKGLITLKAIASSNYVLVESAILDFNEAVSVNILSAIKGTVFENTITTDSEGEARVEFDFQPQGKLFLRAESQ